MMREHELTAEEKKLPYAKYFYQEMAPQEQSNLDILDKGPMNPAKALSPFEVNKLLDPGYHEVEVGYCQMPDGSCYVANHTNMPGVTVDMINWWFAWHALEDIRYKLWCPPFHAGISVSPETRAHILNPETPMTEKFQGISHFVAEDVGGGMEEIVINFMHPEDFGFDMSRFHSPNVGTLVAANGVSRPMGAPEGTPYAPAAMMHFIRETAEGIEFRTRFWMGWHFIDGKPKKLLPEGIKIPVQAAEGLARHNVLEYSNLRAILPQIYKETGGKIF